MEEELGGLGELSGFLGTYGTPIGIGASILGSVFGAISAGKQKRIAERKARKAEKELNRQKEIYRNLDTSNPFLNMQNTMSGLENTMEDLTVNQQQAQFQADQFQQSQSNILSGLSGAAGGSGIAALAQSLAQQGQIAAQQSGASIGQQEAANARAKASEASRLQMAEAGEASRIQGMERQGEVMSRQQELNKQSTLLGMAQQESAAYNAQVGQAQQAKMDAITGGLKGAADMFAGFGQGQSGFTGYRTDENGIRAYYVNGEKQGTQ